MYGNTPTLGLLLLIACLVAIVCRRLGQPFTIGLVLAGIGLSISGYKSGITLTPELVFSVLLPPLVFEAALHLGWGQFRREGALVLSLAFGGTLLSAGVVAGGMHWLAGWGWPASLLFGSLIAATDPVSVIAMMKEQHADKRLRFLMEAESLINDGAAAVLFALVAAWVAGSATSPAGIAMTLISTVGGGVALGLAVAGGLLLIAGRSDDHLVETTLTVLAAYGSFMLAEDLHVSGVLATLSAGMLIGNRGQRRALSEVGGRAIIRFWEFAAFLANSVVFLLIGSREAAQPIAAFWLPAVIGTVTVLAGRAAAIYPITPFFARTRMATDKLTRHILFWGGLRGAMALALALGAPESLPEHDALVSVAFAVVAFSIFVQGLTMPLLLRKSATP
ncbi:cation:proton antiporter [Novosphingobium pituita]|uniref:Cation:proton antiporter n=1 Tax=Novosphingobium pituita TaxID=3056842 RepID=A0ABQ6P6I2_9SPHN|nr:sodium:proton antiporter [Novosphingobium sp. IK01]MDK4806679.1 sodium:proton antiporter [Novosphingobium aromaticivorans]GMM60835.1 cation:proton antiporter [Novosphingobium sp. IK01]